MRGLRYSLASLLLVVGFCGVGLAALRSPSPLWANTLFTFALATLTVALLPVLYGRGARRAYWAGFSLCGWFYLALSCGPGLSTEVGTKLLTTAMLDLLYAQIAPSPAPYGNMASSGYIGMYGGRGGNAGQVQLTGAPFANPQVADLGVQKTRAEKQLAAVQRVARNSNDPSLLLAKKRVHQLNQMMMRANSSTETWKSWTEPDRTTGVGSMVGSKLSLTSPEPFRRIGHSLLALMVAVLGAALARKLSDASTEPATAEGV